MYRFIRACCVTARIFENNAGSSGVFLYEEFSINLVVDSEIYLPAENLSRRRLSCQ